MLSKEVRAISPHSDRPRPPHRPLHRVALAVVVLALASLCVAPAALARHVPDPATAPSATVVAGHVSVRWTASRDGHVVTYRILRAPTATLAFVQIGEIASTLFTDAPGSGSWTYEVVAVDNTGAESPATADVSVVVPRGVPIA